MYDWKATLLGPDETLQKAIEVLDSEMLRIVMVVDKNQNLLGTITDGDVRRALIRHCGMSASVSEVMYKTPSTASTEDDKESILQTMKSEDLLQIPLVEKSGKVVGLETLQQLLQGNRFENPVFLMAGGFGTRLYPLTNDIPKPLLKVGSKPILETILGQFIDSGFHNFYISTHYKADMVRAHFGDGGQWGGHIEYVHEEQPLGTAGAIGLLPRDIPDLPIILMNGDLLTKVNFEHLLKFHNEQGGIATMCVREYDFHVPYGVIESEGHKIQSIVEKPVYSFFVNAGIYVLSPKIIQKVDGTHYLDMPQLLEEQLQLGEQINMFPIHEYWLDIGRMEDYENAQSDVDTLFS
ncbi:nucleotidyltransferase family protein [Litoricola sp.]|nr:nucleotidyltransferase family protein [Litorivicinus sp.]